MTEVAVADNLPLNMFCNLARPLRRASPYCHTPQQPSAYAGSSSHILHEQGRRQHSPDKLQRLRLVSSPLAAILQE